MTVYSVPKPAPKVKQPRPLKRSKMRRRSKSAATWAQQYGSAERAAWIQSQPSVWSGKGPCVNAHTERRTGMGRKGPWWSIVPLTESEHRAFDQRRAPFDVEENRRKVESWAPVVEGRWLAHASAHSCPQIEHLRQENGGAE